jgi:hypothetical protein
MLVLVGGRNMRHLDALTLFEAVTSGGSLTVEQTHHLRHCSDCRRLLWAYSLQEVRKLQQKPEPVEPSKAAA